MTVEIHGFVKSLEYLGSDETTITLALKANRIFFPHHMIFKAKPAEIDSYKVGMPVIVQIRPKPQSTDAGAEKQ